MSTEATQQTMLARDALFRDLARHFDSVDPAEQARIKARMIDTVMTLMPVITEREAVVIVDDILAQDPSSASQLRIKLVDA